RRAPRPTSRRDWPLSLRLNSGGARLTGSDYATLPFCINGPATRLSSWPAEQSCQRSLALCTSRRRAARSPAIFRYEILPFVHAVNGRVRIEHGTMNTLQAVLLGMMLAWTPSLVVLAWLVRRAPLSSDDERGSRRTALRDLHFAALQRKSVARDYDGAGKSKMAQCPRRADSTLRDRSVLRPRHRRSLGERKPRLLPAIGAVRIPDYVGVTHRDGAPGGIPRHPARALAIDH